MFCILCSLQFQINSVSYTHLGFYSALMSVTETGFQVKYISIYNFTPNAKGETYQYIALR